MPGKTTGPRVCSDWLLKIIILTHQVLVSQVQGCLSQTPRESGPDGETEVQLVRSPAQQLEHMEAGVTAGGAVLCPKTRLSWGRGEGDTRKNDKLLAVDETRLACVLPMGNDAQSLP